MTHAERTEASFVDDLGRVLHTSRAARTARACLLCTRDRDQALGWLKRVAEEIPCGLSHFTVAERRRWDAKADSWLSHGGATVDVADLVAAARTVEGGGLVVVEDVLPALSDDNTGDRGARHAFVRCLAQDTAPTGLVLVFLEPPERESCLPSILADQVVRLDVPYPRGGELEEIAREEVAYLQHELCKTVDVDRARTEARRLAPSLAGLTRSAARDALRDALCGPGELRYDTALERLEGQKARTLRRELSMNVLDTAHAEPPLGLDFLVEQLQVLSGRLRTFGNGRARGVLLIGPPGTGKTMLARAIGKLVDLPVVEFRLSSMMNSLLGETERRFARAFAMLEAMSPNVVFIDEIEKAFGDSSERDGGTMMRCTGALLSWLSDNPYPNFVVATSNSLARMGEIGLTMTRSERFDAAFFVDVPSRETRKKMFRRWLDGRLPDAEAVVGALAEATPRFSGADLFSAVKQAQAWAEYRRRPLAAEDVFAQLRRKYRRVEALYREFDALRGWGRMHCDPAGPVDETVDFESTRSHGPTALDKEG